jgi:uncharacterized glyoxalase superfamily metalloenzyme YdcJ
MSPTPFISPDAIRAAFSAAMSAMYRDEVPAYGTLMALVADVNEATLDDPSRRCAPAWKRLRRSTASVRSATALSASAREAELAMMRRVFAVMGMFPVGYYDLSEAGVPVHSTAFRPVGEAALELQPVPGVHLFAAARPDRRRRSARNCRKTLARQGRSFPTRP